MESHDAFRTQLPFPHVMIGRLVLGLLVLTSSLVVLLSMEVRDLHKDVHQAVLAAATLQPGSFVPELRVRSTTGSEFELGSTGGRRHVYIAYTTTCPFCRASVGAWKALYTGLSIFPDVQVIGVSPSPLDSITDYQRRHELPFESVTLASARDVALHRFERVPQVLVVNEFGQVTYSRRGKLDLGPATDSIISHVAQTDE